METVNAMSRTNCDFISSLPDHILHDILGFLKTKEAVQTCVLSKHWEDLWTHLPSLNFARKVVSPTISCWEELGAFLSGLVNVEILEIQVVLAQLQELGASISKSSNGSLSIVISQCKRLEIVEIKYIRRTFSQWKSQLAHDLMDLMDLMDEAKKLRSIYLLPMP